MIIVDRDRMVFRVKPKVHAQVIIISSPDILLRGNSVREYVLLLSFMRVVDERRGDSQRRRKKRFFYVYLRQVNEVNGGDNVFVGCASVCLCLCAADRSIRPVNKKTVKATVFKFDTHVPRDSPDMTS